MPIELLVHETHALGVKVDRIAEKVDRVAGAVDTLKSVVTDLLKLATSHEGRFSTLEGVSQ